MARTAGGAIRHAMGAASLLAILAGGPAPAGAEEVDFRGGGYLRGFSEACAERGYVAPVYVNAIYRPRKLGSNGASTRLSFFFPQFYATSYELPRGKLGRGFKTVVGGATGSATTFFSSRPRMRITRMRPKQPRPETPTLSLAGQIENFDGIKDCTASFRLSLQRGP